MLELVINATKQLIFLFVPEAIFLIFVQRKNRRFKMRFSKVENYPGLKPFAGVWKVGIIALIIYLVTASILDSDIAKPFGDWLSSLDWNVGFLTVSIFFFNLVVIVNYVFEKKRDKITILFLIVFGIFLSIFLYATGFLKF